MVSQQKLEHPWPPKPTPPAAVPPLTLWDPVLPCCECYMNLRIKILFLLLWIGSGKSSSLYNCWDLVYRARIQMQGKICAHLLHILHSSLCNYNGKGFKREFPFKEENNVDILLLNRTGLWNFIWARTQKFTQDKSTAVPVTACEDNTALLLDKNYLGIMICAVWTSAR